MLSLFYVTTLDHSTAQIFHGFEIRLHAFNVSRTTPSVFPPMYKTSWQLILAVTRGCRLHSKIAISYCDKLDVVLALGWLIMSNVDVFVLKSLATGHTTATCKRYS